MQPTASYRGRAEAAVVACVRVYAKQPTLSSVNPQNQSVAVETTLDVVDDVLSVDMISDLMDHVAADPLLRRIASPDRTFLCGHSRVRCPGLR